MGKQWKQCQTLFFWAPKSLQVVTAAMKLKDAYSLEGKLWPPRQHIKKQRHYFANQGLSSQSYGFSRDGSPPGSSVPGILQARILEWVAISFSNAWKWKVKVKSLSRVRPSATLWTVAYQAPLSMGFSRQEYWSRVPWPSPLLPLLLLPLHDHNIFIIPSVSLPIHPPTHPPTHPSIHSLVVIHSS